MSVSNARSLVELGLRAIFETKRRGEQAMIRWSFLAGLAAVVSACGAMAAQAAVQTPPQAEPQTVAFGAWETRCPSAAQPGAAGCRVVSSITVPVAEGQRAVAAVIVVQAAPQLGSVQLAVQLPITVWLPPGVRVETAAGDLVAQFPFVVCASNVCEAGAVLTGDQWAQMAANTTSLSLRYELQGQQGAKLDFSMDGFVAAATSVGLKPA